MSVSTSLRTPSIYGLLAERGASSGDDQALLIADSDGAFQPITWAQLQREVCLWVDVLHQHDVRPGDPVVQWSANRYEWILVDLALSALQAIHVPLHDGLSPSQAAAQIAHCGARLILVDKSTKIPSLLCRDQPYAPRLKTLCYDIDATNSRTSRNSRYCVADLLTSATAVGGQTVIQSTAPAGDSADIATILYSSGTTGQPKGIALTHENLLSNATMVAEQFGETRVDVRMCFLPLSHIYARTCDMNTWLVSGSQLALARSTNSVLLDCQIIRPTLVNAVPSIYDAIRRELMDSGVADEPDGLRKSFGGEIRACCCGGAPLDDDTFRFYHDRGVPLLPGYGLTEASPVLSLSTPDNYKLATVGKPLTRVELQFGDDGEIRTRGPHVMHGYWGDDPLTSDSIDEEGWLRTGDIGELDEEGYLRIIGRKKEMIVTATGKKAYPTHIESLLCRDALIEQAFVTGDRQKYLGALIVPNRDAMAAAVKRLRRWPWNWKPGLHSRLVTVLYRKAIRSQLKELSKHEQVQQFRLITRPFSQQAGQLTAKLSLCRSQIESDYAADIAKLRRIK